MIKFCAWESYFMSNIESIRYVNCHAYELVNLSVQYDCFDVSSYLFCLEHLCCAQKIFMIMNFFRFFIYLYKYFLAPSAFKNI